jgi:hypothetical protein
VVFLIKTDSKVIEILLLEKEPIRKLIKHLDAVLEI